MRFRPDLDQGMVADSGGVYLDPDPTFEIKTGSGSDLGDKSRIQIRPSAKTGPGSDRQEKPDSDPTFKKNRIQIRP